MDRISSATAFFSFLGTLARTFLDTWTWHLWTLALENSSLKTFSSPGIQPDFGNHQLLRFRPGDPATGKGHLDNQRVFAAFVDCLNPLRLFALFGLRSSLDPSASFFCGNNTDFRGKYSLGPRVYRDFSLGLCRRSGFFWDRAQPGQDLFDYPLALLFCPHHPAGYYSTLAGRAVFEVHSEQSGLTKGVFGCVATKYGK